MGRRVFLCMSIGTMLLCQLVPACGAPLTPDQVRWARRARAVWRAYRVDWDSKAKMREAERAMLAVGSSRDATTELRTVLRELPLSDPARYPIGFTMALLDLGYRDGRDVLLRYLRADGKPYGVPIGPHSIIPDPNDDPREPDIATDWHGLPGMVYFVYQRHRDPVLLSALLDLTMHADGAVADVLSGVLRDLAQDHPRALLKGLRPKPTAVWRQTADQLAYETRRGPGDSLLPVETEYVQMSHIERSRHDPLRRAARRLLANVRAEQRRQG